MGTISEFGSGDTGSTPDTTVGQSTPDTTVGQSTPDVSMGQSAPNTTEGQPSQESRPRDTTPHDTVFIGKKPLMAYVTSTLLQLVELPSVNIRARGMSISRAVDVAQIVSRKRDNTGYSIGNIELDSETLDSTDGKQRNVSTISIIVRRN